jgi:hypothetical protein
MAGEFRIFSMESSRVAVDAGSATVGHPDTPFPYSFTSELCKRPRFEAHITWSKTAQICYADTPLIKQKQLYLLIRLLIQSELAEDLGDLDATGRCF